MADWTGYTSDKWATGNGQPFQRLCLHLHSLTAQTEPMTLRQATGIAWRARQLRVHIPFLPLRDDCKQRLTKAEADVLIRKLDRCEVPTAEWLNSLGRQPPVCSFPIS